MVFPVHGSTEWPRQGPPPHLTRETISGRRPADGAIHPAESFVPAKTWPWGGGEDKVCGCRLNPSLISEVLSSLAARCISQSGSVLRRLYLRPQPQLTTIFPGTKDSYTHPTTPSAGRTGGVLTCLTKSPYALAAAQMNCYVNYKINIKHPEQT